MTPFTQLWFEKFEQYLLCYEREKGRDLIQSYYKSPYTNRTFKTTKWKHKDAYKMFAQQLQADLGRLIGAPTANWHDYAIYGPSLSTHRNSRVIKRTYI